MSKEMNIKTLQSLIRLAEKEIKEWKGFLSFLKKRLEQLNKKPV